MCIYGGNACGLRVNHYDFVALHSMWIIFLKGLCVLVRVKCHKIIMIIVRFYCYMIRNKQCVTDSLLQRCSGLEHRLTHYAL